MKKQIIPKKSGLNLAKRTITNLEASEMSNYLGGINANVKNGHQMKVRPFTKRCQGW